MVGRAQGCGRGNQAHQTEMAEMWRMMEELSRAVQALQQQERADAYMEILERNREPFHILEGGGEDEYEDEANVNNPFHEAGNHGDGDRGGLEGAVHSNSLVSFVNLDIPPIFDRCLEEDCEICLGVEKTFDKVFGETTQDESSVICKAGLRRSWV